MCAANDGSREAATGGPPQELAAKRLVSYIPGANPAILKRGGFW